MNDIYCNNCGKPGHIYNQCKIPITSYGVIAFRYNPDHELELLMICRKDMNIKSINNLACVIIHESHHLYIQQNDIVLTSPKEELECYYWELEFIKKLPNPEVWLEQHIIRCIINYKEE